MELEGGNSSIMSYGADENDENLTFGGEFVDTLKNIAFFSIQLSLMVIGIFMIIYFVQLLSGKSYVKHHYNKVINNQKNPGFTYDEYLLNNTLQKNKQCYESNFNAVKGSSFIYAGSNFIPANCN